MWWQKRKSHLSTVTNTSRIWNCQVIVYHIWILSWRRLMHQLYRRINVNLLQHPTVLQSIFSTGTYSRMYVLYDDIKIFQIYGRNLQIRCIKRKNFTTPVNIQRILYLRILIISAITQRVLQPIIVDVVAKEKVSFVNSNKYI